MAIVLDVAMTEDASGIAELVGRVMEADRLYSDAAKRQLRAVFVADDIVEGMAAAPSCFLVAREGSDLVGFSFSRREAGALELCWVMVDPAARRHRIGPALYDAALQQARWFECAKIWGMSLVANAGVVRHVVRSGGRVVGTLHRHAHGQDYVLWEHLLD